MLLRSNFSSFPHYFIYIFLTSGVKLHIHLLNVVVQFIVFLTLSTLICRSTDISKCFSESLGIRDNKSRLYYVLSILVCNILSNEKREHNQLKETWQMANDQFLESQRLMMMDMRRMESLLSAEQQRQLTGENCFFTDGKGITSIYI